MKKGLFLLLLFFVVSGCDGGYDDVTPYCWECQSSQSGEYWTDYFEGWTEYEIQQLIEDDRNENPSIYTYCNKIPC